METQIYNITYFLKTKIEYCYSKFFKLSFDTPFPFQ